MYINSDIFSMEWSIASAFFPCRYTYSRETKLIRFTDDWAELFVNIDTTFVILTNSVQGAENSLVGSASFNDYVVSFLTSVKRICHLLSDCSGRRVAWQGFLSMSHSTALMFDSSTLHLQSWRNFIFLVILRSFRRLVLYVVMILFASLQSTWYVNLSWGHSSEYRETSVFWCILLIWSPSVFIKRLYVWNENCLGALEILCKRWSIYLNLICCGWFRINKFLLCFFLQKSKGCFWFRAIVNQMNSISV